MPRNPRLGPLVLPWESGSAEEVVVFLFTGLLGAVVAATVLHHYRRRRG